MLSLSQICDKLNDWWEMYLRNDRMNGDMGRSYEKRVPC